MNILKFIKSLFIKEKPLITTSTTTTKLSSEMIGKAVMIKKKRVIKKNK